ncbi:MFS transporter [Jatrophihabitans sp.]|uniref:MFS transporter n=1 Tax=Jatrophihabitans sp. TaxID=1932789 RepID=UPI002B926FE9|nr:MFS transporter [Jatrophihabitans sp.]
MSSGRVPFIALLTAATVSQAGTRMSNLAVPWLVLTETGSPVLTGLVGTAEIAPYVVLQILGSPLVDRLGGHRVALVGNLVAGLAMAAIPLAWHTGWQQLWAVLALVFVVGLVRGPADTAAHILLPPVAERAGISIDRATALSEGALRLAGLLGAPAAGVLITVIGPANVVAFDAASFLACAALLLLVPVGAGLTERNGLGYLRQLSEGFGFVRRHPLLRSISGMVLFTNLADAAMSGVLLLLWAERHYGSAGRVGVISGVFGAAAVAGTMVMVAIGSRLPRRWTFAVAFLVGGAPRFVVLALPAPFAVVLAVWGLSGLTCGAINPVLGAAEYQVIPRALQARVLATVNALAWAGIPFGALLAGALVEATGLGTALAVGAVLYLAATLDPFLRRSWDLMNRPAQVEVAEPDAGDALVGRSPS